MTATPRQPLSFRAARVASRAGYRGAEQPIRLERDGAWIEIAGILQRWRDPDHEYFRVRLETGARTILRHPLDADDWEIADDG